MLGLDRKPMNVVLVAAVRARKQALIRITTRLGIIALTQYLVR